MKRYLSILVLGLSSIAAAKPITPRELVDEVVYVEAPTDTDQDGELDRIYVKVTRPSGQTNLPTIYTITPYADGGNDVPNHDVDVDRLPQDSESMESSHAAHLKTRLAAAETQDKVITQALERGYASVSAHSVGTGRSTGCPSVGDETETLAAKAVIDWLNGKARAFDSDGHEVTASWANGSVGMTGVSYNGTLPNMVATTGVEGLKAIVPVAAISSWYDYYRAGGLVVGPGGYIGEDADVLGKFIVRAGACGTAITKIARTMGREHGDFSEFWQARDYVAKADGVKAAVFIMHGQTDWNVRQRHAIRWWEALEGRVPLKMWLHRGGHGQPSRTDTSDKMWAWFDRYVKGEPNGIENEPPIDVESPRGSWTTQQAWPSEETTRTTLYLNPEHELAATPFEGSAETIVDEGKTTRLDRMLSNPTRSNPSRLTFVTEPLSAPRLLSGTTKMQLSLAVLNRRAANITVAVVEYDENGYAKVVTRGWVDPQNHADLKQGEPLVPGTNYQLTFDLEPKQYTFARGSRIGVVVTATDYEHTLRPDAGTEISVAVGRDSFVEMSLSGD